MKLRWTITFLALCYLKHASGTLVDGIVTLSWTLSGSSPVVDRFLSRDTHIQLRLLCREPSTNTNQTQEQIRKSLNKNYAKTKVTISGRIGRIVGCLPLQSDSFMTASKRASKDGADSRTIMQSFYEDLWKEMEIRKFEMKDAPCEYDGELAVEQYFNMTDPEISPDEALAKRKKLFEQSRDDDQTSKSSDFDWGDDGTRQFFQKENEPVVQLTTRRRRTKHHWPP